MPWRLKFTMRQALLLVTIVALLLGGIRWVRVMLSTNPKSGRLVVGGVETPVKWTTTAWREPYFSGYMLGLGSRGITGFRKPDAIDVKQELFAISYNNYFGQRTFHRRFTVQGWHQPDWSDWNLEVTATDLPSTDGECSIVYDFDPSKNRYKIRLMVFIRSQQEVRHTALEFTHDGSSFVRVDSPE